MTKIIKIQREDTYDIYAPYESDIAFLGASFTRSSNYYKIFEENLQKIQSLVSDEAYQEALLRLVASYDGSDTGEDILEEINFYEETPFETLLEAWKNGLSYEILESLYDYTKPYELIEKIATLAGLTFMMVSGYVQGDWDYAIFDSNISKDFVQDLYNGDNFYYIQILDEDGSFVDFCGGFYLPSDEDLENCLKDWIGDECFYIVDNDAVAYTFENFPRVFEEKHISYTYSVK